MSVRFFFIAMVLLCCAGTRDIHDHHHGNDGLLSKTKGIGHLGQGCKSNSFRWKVFASSKYSDAEIDCALDSGTLYAEM